MSERPPATGSGSPEPRPTAEDDPPPSTEGDGVDATLIRWMLSLTPGERLRVLQDHVRATLSLRDGRP